MTRIESVKNITTENKNKPIYKGNTRVVTNADLQKRVATVLSETYVKNSTNPGLMDRVAAKAKKIANILTSGSISDKNLDDVESRLYLIA